MSLLIAIAISVLFVAVFRNQIHLHPTVFYCVALALDILMLLYRVTPLDSVVVRDIVVYVQRSLLAISLFAIVMFIGALPDSSKVRGALMPIRGELSIIAGLLVIGHMAGYLVSYFLNILTNYTAVDVNIMVSLVLAVVLLVLLSILFVTSFRFVKRRMTQARWRRVQRLAYPFFGLVYVHIMLMILPSALRGGGRAIIGVVVYTLIFGIYAVMKWMRSREKQSVSDQADRNVVTDG